MWNLRILLQLRYSYKEGTEEKDYILSPVAPFFDSRNAKESEPKDADANGAYHIALKGLLQLQKIRTGEKKLAISKKKWHDFAQERTYRK